ESSSRGRVRLPAPEPWPPTSDDSIGPPPCQPADACRKAPTPTPARESASRIRTRHTRRWNIRQTPLSQYPPHPASAPHRPRASPYAPDLDPHPIRRVPADRAESAGSATQAPLPLDSRIRDHKEKDEGERPSARSPELRRRSQRRRCAGVP